MILITLIFSILLGLLLVGVIVNEIYAQHLKISAVPTFPSVQKQILEVIAVSDVSEAATIYELGSGWGGLAHAIGECFPEMSVRGFEVSPLPYLVSKLRQRSNVRFTRADLFKLDLLDANVLVFYLSPWHAKELAVILRGALKPGTLIISSGFPLPEWEIEQTVFVQGGLENAVYVYRA